jgi:hypothetical protein
VAKMVTDFEVNELCWVYKKMDKKGKEKMVLMAKKLLGVQLVENEQEGNIEELKLKNEKSVLKL